MWVLVFVWRSIKGYDNEIIQHLRKTATVLVTCSKEHESGEQYENSLQYDFAIKLWPSYGTYSVSRSRTCACVILKEKNVVVKYKGKSAESEGWKRQGDIERRGRQENDWKVYKSKGNKRARQFKKRKKDRKKYKNNE